MKKDLRKCSRNFLRYCDENDDASITLEEWIDCTGINGTKLYIEQVITKCLISPLTDTLILIHSYFCC